jgi:cadmium resistance transport/sequestration family protein
VGVNTLEPMTAFLATLILAATIFAATNIDDIFILVLFFADPRKRAYDIILGQYLGIVALVAASAVAGFIAIAIPPAYVGLLGLAPIFIGIRQLLQLRQSKEEANASGGGAVINNSRAEVFNVAAVTIANGGDNLAVYTPVFSTRSAGELILTIGVFLIMTGVWCAGAQRLVYHPTIGSLLRRYGQRAAPFVLIGLGIWIMFDAGA